MPSLEYIDHKITDAITILPQNGIPSFKADAMQTKYPAGMMILKFRIYLTECVIIIINTIFSLENHAIQYKNISSKYITRKLTCLRSYLKKISLESQQRKR